MGKSFSTPNLVYRLEHGSAADKEIAAEYLCGKVKRYSDHQEFIQAVAKYSTKHLVEMAKNGTAKGKQYASATLSYLAIEPKNKVLIMEEGALPVLIELAKTGTLEQKGTAAVAFANLASRNPENQAKIVKAGAIPLLLDMMKESEDGHYQVRTWAASALGNLGSQNAANQEKLGAAGAIVALLDMLSAKMPAFALQSEEGTMVKIHNVVTCRKRKKDEQPKGPSMAEGAARNLNILLYSHKLNQERLVNANGITTLLTLVKEGTPREQVEALRTIGNVWGQIGPEVVNSKLVEAGGIELLVEISRTSQIEAREAASGLIARLASNSLSSISSADYRSKIVEAGGIGAMVELFESGSPQARIWTTKALTSLANGSEEYRQKIKEAGGTSALELFEVPGMRISGVSAEVAKAVAEEAKADEDKKEKEEPEQGSSQEARQRKGGAADPVD